MTRNHSVFLLVLFILTIRLPVLGDPFYRIVDLVSGVYNPYKYIYADTSGNLPLDKVIAKADELFISDDAVGGIIKDPEPVYWVRFHLEKNKSFVLKVVPDFTQLELFIQQDQKIVKQKSFSEISVFSKSFNIPDYAFALEPAPFNRTCYLKFKTTHLTGLGIYLMTYPAFYKEILKSLTYYGFYAGILLLAITLSLVLLFFLRERLYLWYNIYLVSFTFFALALWDLLSHIIEVGRSKSLYTIPFAIMTCAMTLYTSEFLKSSKIKGVPVKIFHLLVLIRILILMAGIGFDIPFLFSQRVDFFILMVPFVFVIIALFENTRLTWSFAAGFILYMTGMFFHSQFIFLPQTSGFNFLNFSLFEIVFFTIALVNRYRRIREEKEKAVRDLMLEYEQHNKLKDELNEKLETKVIERTLQLEEAKHQLEQQAERIRRLNEALHKENISLENEVKNIAKARVTLKAADFIEFTKSFPSDESCLEYLSELKWGKGFSCRKCNHKNYSAGKLPFARRCTKCNYDESPAAHTIFYRVKFSLQKAFYILYLVDIKKDITLEEISNQIGLRKMTISNFRNKVILKRDKKDKSERGIKNWIKIIFN